MVKTMELLIPSVFPQNSLGDSSAARAMSRVPLATTAAMV